MDLIARPSPPWSLSLGWPARSRLSSSRLLAAESSNSSPAVHRVTPFPDVIINAKASNTLLLCQVSTFPSDLLASLTAAPNAGCTELTIYLNPRLLQPILNSPPSLSTPKAGFEPGSSFFSRMPDNIRANTVALSSMDMGRMNVSVSFVPTSVAASLFKAAGNTMQHPQSFSSSDGSAAPVPVTAASFNPTALRTPVKFSDLERFPMPPTRSQPSSIKGGGDGSPPTSPYAGPSGLSILVQRSHSSSPTAPHLSDEQHIHGSDSDETPTVTPLAMQPVLLGLGHNVPVSFSVSSFEPQTPNVVVRETGDLNPSANARNRHVFFGTKCARLECTGTILALVAESFGSFLCRTQSRTATRFRQHSCSAVRT